MSDMKTFDADTFQLRFGGKSIPPDGIQSQAGRFVVLDVEIPTSVRLPARRMPVLPTPGTPKLPEPPLRCL
jgi:hypothetical protein